tara:strand:+ start:401 stop:1282 length:882 start_codon:yes stop_codon:yes gene_type:complete
MSQTTIVKRFRVDNVLTTATSAKLSADDASYGVKRTDTGAVVVADDTSMTEISTGIYAYTFTDPADDLTYQYSTEFVYGGETYHMVANIAGGSDQSDNLYDLLPQIQTLVEGDITDNFIKQRIREMFQDFCIRTEAWRTKLDAVTSVADQKEYTLAATVSSTTYLANILRVKDVLYDTDETQLTFDEVSSDGLTLTLTSATAEAGNDIVADVILIPKETLSQTESWILDRWGKAVVYGVVWDLKSMSGRPWSDPRGADKYWGIYLDRVADAKREQHTKRGPGNSLRVASRAFV